jgi:hypothetical protein
MGVIKLSKESHLESLAKDMITEPITVYDFAVYRSAYY